MTYSPALAIFTGLFEFSAAGWIFLGRGGRRRILNPVGLILLLLAGYQFAEVAVCFKPSEMIFTRLAFFDITWLPPLALWLGYQIAAPRKRGLRLAAWVDIVAGLILSIWVFADRQAITKSVCQTVIARYEHAPAFEIAYGIFYQASLAFLIFAAAAQMASAQDAVLRKHWANLQAGILGFALPSLAVRVLVAEQPGLLPSVMCHFALVLAVSLVFLAIRERRSYPQG